MSKGLTVKKIGLFGFLFLHSLLVHAEELGLGRFFTTPEQRSDMDRIKIHQDFSANESENSDLKGLRQEVLAEERKKITPLPNQITMKGYVSRKGGSQTVWVNEGSSSFKSVYRSTNKNHHTTRIFHSTKVDGNLRIYKKSSRSDKIGVAVLGQGKVRLKPGQTYNTQTKKIQDNYKIPPPVKTRPTQQQAVAFPVDDALLEGNQQRIQQLQSLSELGKKILK